MKFVAISSFAKAILTSMFLALVHHPANAAADWSVTNLALLHGDDYKLEDDAQYSITIDHARSWRYGDLFMFIDIFNPATADSNEYGEIHPRFSFSKITGKDFSNSYVKDMYIATEVELGENHRAWLYGVGFDFKVAGFNYFNMNVYVRDNIRQDGKTWQVTPYWQLPFSIGATKWTFEGFADIAGTEDNSEHNIIFQPQLLWDIEAHPGSSGSLKAGIEYNYWRNKFGVKGVTQSTPQLILKYSF